jgi:hypothetical protein
MEKLISEPTGRTEERQADDQRRTFQHVDEVEGIGS